MQHLRHMFHEINFLHIVFTGNAYGDGVYFAVDASYSANSRYSPKDSSGYSYMFYSQVLTGEYCDGSGGMKVPPMKGDPKNQIIHYDSTVDNENSPTIFVVYYDTQAYPQYLVTFK